MEPITAVLCVLIIVFNPMQKIMDSEAKSEQIQVLEQKVQDLEKSKIVEVQNAK